MVEIMQDDEIPNGWPLGLGNMNSRIRVVGASQMAAAPPPQPSAPPRRFYSSSFSSLTSSNLDTESTASFFPDQSVTLGRLIGIRPANKRSLCYEQRRINCVSGDSGPGGVPNNEDLDQHIHGHVHGHGGLCVPLIHRVISKMGRSPTISTN